MGFSGWYHLDFRVIRRETKKAFEVIASDNKIYFIQKSQVADAGDYKAGDRDGTISIPDWLAAEKGLE